MNDTLNAQLETISCKFRELDSWIDELCSRIDGNDADVRDKFTQFQSSFNEDLITIQNYMSLEQQRTQESQNALRINNEIQLNDIIKALGDRISLSEGQSA